MRVEAGVEVPISLPASNKPQATSQDSPGPPVPHSITVKIFGMEGGKDTALPPPYPQLGEQGPAWSSPIARRSSLWGWKGWEGAGARSRGGQLQLTTQNSKFRAGQRRGGIWWVGWVEWVAREAGGRLNSMKKPPIVKNYQPGVSRTHLSLLEPRQQSTIQLSENSVGNRTLLLSTARSRLHIQ